MMQIATCRCGGLTARTNADPLLTAVCGCEDCRMRTGSVFSVHPLFRMTDVEIAGEERLYTRLGDSGRNVHFHFCPDCGATVHWEAESKPGLWGISAGAFRNVAAFTPAAAVWMADKPGWVLLDGSIPTYPRAGDWAAARKA